MIHHQRLDIGQLEYKTEFVRKTLERLSLDNYHGFGVRAAGADSYAIQPAGWKEEFHAEVDKCEHWLVSVSQGIAADGNLLTRFCRRFFPPHYVLTLIFDAALQHHHAVGYDQRDDELHVRLITSRHELFGVLAVPHCTLSSKQTWLVSLYADIVRRNCSPQGVDGELSRQG